MIRERVSEKKNGKKVENTTVQGWRVLKRDDEERIK